MASITDGSFRRMLIDVSNEMKEFWVGENLNIKELQELKMLNYTQSSPAYQVAKVNGKDDFAVIGDTKHLIGKFVKVIKQKKNGVFLVAGLDSDEQYSIPKKNLDFLNGWLLATVDNTSEVINDTTN